MDITLALQRLVRRYRNGTNALAAAVDMSPTTLLHKVSPTYGAQFCSPEEMLALMEAADDNDPLHVLAAARHMVLLPMPRLEHAADEDVATGLLVQSVKEFADVATALTESLRRESPGAERITANELAKLKREAAEAMAAINELMAWASARHAAGKLAALREVA